VKRIPVLIALLLSLSLLAAGCGDDDAGPSGRAIYQASCSSCHGSDGGGGVGPAMKGNPFVAGSSDADVAEVIAAGRSGTAMPGFPLSQEDLDAVVAYLRTLDG
jgi:mono/diheme cytochrome c family protein